MKTLVLLVATSLLFVVTMAAPQLFAAGTGQQQEQQQAQPQQVQGIGRGEVPNQFAVPGGFGGPFQQQISQNQQQQQQPTSQDQQPVLQPYPGYVNNFYAPNPGFHPGYAGQFLPPN